jgi:excisionase family DNA binding protein
MPPAPAATTPPPPDALMTDKEVAAYLRVPAETLRKWRQHGSGPQFAKLGRYVRYCRSDVDAWVTAQRAAATA